jgi:aminoglycoside phosphotransferase (APT) family kinase protein
VVQQFVEGVSPGTGWIDEHVDEVGTLIKRYRDAAALHELVRPLCRADYVAELSNRLELTASEVLRGALQSIAKETFDAEAEPTVTHGDLNTSNFILRPDGRLCLVDWDDARASDPMRDLGPLLWWYVRPTRWRTAVMAAGHPFDPLTHDRIFWWAASRSIDVALWLVEHGEYERAARFAEDADAAARGLSNPRGWWVT